MSRKTGYSLFEVLIAFAIMSIVLVTLIPGQATLQGRTETTTEEVLAHELALSVLDLALEVGVENARQGVILPESWKIKLETSELGPVSDLEQFLVVEILTDQDRSLAKLNARFDE